MADIKRPTFLRLVTFERPSDPIADVSLVRPAWQSTLFATENPDLLLFVDLDRLGGTNFLRLLAEVRPRHVFDLRKAPRFDFGPLNRRTAFLRMADAGATYHDLSGLLEGSPPHRDRVAELVRKHAADRTTLTGPLAFLVDKNESNEAFVTELSTAIGAPTSGVWDVMLVPVAHASSAPEDRPVVFISHANPEDNEFTKWLAGQLSVAGYEVWADVVKLVGGEEFWSDIESVIRDKAGAVVVVLSAVAQRKAGVLDEIDLAVRVERSRGMKGFVVPVRVDDLPFSEVRANLARKNIIDFHRNWAGGLRSLFSALEKANVPRTPGSLVAAGAAAAQRERGAVIGRAEKLVTNWLPIASFPPNVVLWDVGGPQESLEVAFQALESPAQRYLRLIATFGPDSVSPFEAAGVVIRPGYSLSVEELRAVGSKDPPIIPLAGRNLLLNLLRQAWDREMASRGMMSHPTANGASVWFPAKGRWPSDRGTFKSSDGRSRYRSLVGWSERRKVFWHCGVDARPVLGDFPRYVLRQHVIFTEDGHTPLRSAARMHSLRRSFCRSWWNDRWRDLLAAYVGTLSDNDGTIEIQAGRGTTLRLRPLLLLDANFAPLEDLPASSEEEDLSTDDLDAGDDFDEWLEDDFEDEAPA